MTELQYVSQLEGQPARLASRTSPTNSADDEKMKPISPAPYLPARSSPASPVNAPNYTQMALAAKAKTATANPVTPDEAENMTYTEMAIVAKTGQRPPARKGLGHERVAAIAKALNS